MLGCLMRLLGEDIDELRGLHPSMVRSYLQQWLANRHGNAQTLEFYVCCQALRDEPENGRQPV